MEENALPDKITPDLQIVAKSGYSFKDIAPGVIQRSVVQHLPLRLALLGYPRIEDRHDRVLFIDDNADGEKYIQEHLTQTLRSKVRAMFSNFSDLRSAYKGATGRTLRKWEDWEKNISGDEVLEFWEKYAQTQGKTSVALLTSSNTNLADGTQIKAKGHEKDGLIEVEPNLWLFKPMETYSAGVSSPLSTRGWYNNHRGGVGGAWHVRLFKDEKGFVVFTNNNESKSIDAEKYDEVLSVTMKALQVELDASHAEAKEHKASNSYYNRRVQEGASETWNAELEIPFNLSIGDDEPLIYPIARYRVSDQWENGKGLKELAKKLGVAGVSKMNVEELKEAVAEASAEAASQEEIPAGFIVRSQRASQTELEQIPYYQGSAAEAVVAGSQKLGKTEAGFLHPALPLIGQRLVSMRYSSGYICKWLNPYEEEGK